MAAVKWEFQGREFGNCNCSYGCPCQFNALPTYGNCSAVLGIQIDKGHHGDTKLDGLRAVGVYQWPGAVHQGNGQGYFIIDERANAAQRSALLHIMTGQDTTPGATMLQVFHSMLSKVHDPVHAKIDFEVDIDGRHARLVVPGHVDTKGEPILNPITGKEHRIRIEPVGGFEFRTAEIARGWTRTSGAVRLDLKDSFGYFAQLHLSQDGIVN
jgi:hypothetical protein